MQFRMRRRPGPAVLSVVYWGEDLDREVVIEIDGRQIAVEKRPPPREREWITTEYSLPPTTMASSVVRFIARRGDAVIYEVRVITPTAAAGV